MEREEQLRVAKGLMSHLDNGATMEERSRYAAAGT